MERRADVRGWIAVMGSGQVDSQHPVYVRAARCGELLARHGWGIVTGGYFGVMEAAARSARAQGGRVRSVPCREFRRNAIHPYADEVIWTDQYEDRIRTLCGIADGYFILLGGIGTMAELFYVWSIAQVRYPRHLPVVLVGPEWSDVLVSWRTHLLIPERDWQLIVWTPSPEEAVEWLESWSQQQNPPKSSPTQEAHDEQT